MFTKPTKAGKSGLAICTKKQCFQSVLAVTTSGISNILTVRVDCGSSTIRVILGYAPQETETAEVRESFFTELEVEVLNCKVEEDYPIVLGDMNSKVSYLNGKIVHHSPNGKLFSELIENQ